MRREEWRGEGEEKGERSRIEKNREKRKSEKERKDDYNNNNNNNQQQQRLERPKQKQHAKKNSTTVSPQKSNTTNQNMTALSANCHVSLSPQHIGPNEESKTKEKKKEGKLSRDNHVLYGGKKKRGNSERGEGTVVISFGLGVTDCLDDWGEGKEGGTKTSVAGCLSFLLGRCPLGRSAINCCRCPTPL